MTAPLTFALAYAGFLALALAMHRHAAEVLGTRHLPPVRRHSLRIAGWVLLAASLWASVAAWAPAFGLIGWLGIMTASGLLLVLTLAGAPRVSLHLALPLLAMGGVLALFGGW